MQELSSEQNAEQETDSGGYAFCDATAIGGMCDPGFHHPEAWTRRVSVGNDDEHEETDMVCDSCAHFIRDIEESQKVPAASGWVTSRLASLSRAFLQIKVVAKTAPS